MSGQSSLYGAVLAFSVVFAGFSVFSVWAPAGVPLNAVWDYELIQDVVFERGDYKALELVQARLVYLNPSDKDVQFYLSYPISYSVYFDGILDRSGGDGAEEGMKKVTIPAEGEYVLSHASFQPSAAGWYEVEWGNVRKGIEVVGSDAVVRIVTDKEWYAVGENGHATLEFYNPKPYNVTMGLPLRVEITSVYPNGEESSVTVSYIAWAYRNRTLAPGESFKILEFYVKTPKAGNFILEGMGARTTVHVFPTSP